VEGAAKHRLDSHTCLQINVTVPGTQTDWLNMHVLYLPFWRHTTTRICCYRIVSNNGIIYMAKQNNVG